MKYNYENVEATVTPHQAKQFQILINKLFQCCQERMQYQSDRFNLPDAELRCLMLFGEERYLTPKGIAHKMNVVKSRITKIIDGLIRKDLIHSVNYIDGKMEAVKPFFRKVIFIENGCISMWIYSIGHNFVPNALQ